MNLEEHVVESTSGEYARKVWLMKGAMAKTQRLCIFLDAEYYLGRMDAPALLSDLQAREVLPALTCLLVSHRDSAARHTDYTCSENFSRFIAQDLIAWVRKTSAGISEHGNLICGLSLSGLASAYLALTYPQLFPYALCQSGSFWWNDEWLARTAKTYSSAPGKFWISVGDREVDAGVTHAPSGMVQGVSQIAAAERIVEELKGMGASVNYHLFSGGHEFAPWKQELPAALRWLLGQTPEPASDLNRLA